MSHASFVHLRIHSAYSLAEGAIRIDDIADCAKKHAMPAAALTDTNSLAGSFEFTDNMQKNGIKPILGCQLDIALDEEKNSTHYGGVVFLVSNKTGYHNLCHLSSRAHIDPPGLKPAIIDPLLEKSHEGLIMLSGGVEGPIGRLFMQKGEKAATEYAEKLANLFPDRFYIELQRHGIQQEKESEGFFINIAMEKGWPIVATNQCFFPTPSFHQAHDILICIAEGHKLNSEQRRKISDQHYLKSPEEMRNIFSDLPEACDNSVTLAMRCNFLIEKSKPKLPIYHDLKAGKTETETLISTANQGLKERLEAIGITHDEEEPYYQRLDYELEIISNVDFSGYFLIIADIIKWARTQNIPVGPGRGSGAGSLVAWALRITNINPLQWGLLFERFLNPERISMPDFDIDFCQEGREKIIDYVQETYGHERVAQIITFGTLQARACIRDVGRVIGMPYGQVDQISKMIPLLLNKEKTLSNLKLYAPPLADLEKQNHDVAELLAKARKIEGLYRHASTHAAGIVIGAENLEKITPLYRDPKSSTNMPATQFTMKYVENTGLVKFDFLGLTTLSIIQYCLDLIAQHHTKINIDTIDLTDRETFKTIGSGNCFGVFQMESQGMRDVLVKMKPDQFSDLIAAVALYRPGPMENIPLYINRKHGKEKISYLHPKLESILKETYGIPVYQEQVMQMAQILANYTLGGADKLRRAMGKKNIVEMQAEEKTFLEGCKKNNINPKTAKHIFSQMQAFAGYGFNKSHAAAYAMLAYQTAWLKTHHPSNFMAASMQFAINNTDRLALYAQPIKNMALQLLPPDINQSQAGFSVEIGKDKKPAIRYALGAIRHLGVSAMEKCVKERHKNGSFKNLFDLASRCAGLCNRRMLQNLIASGACDSLNQNRAQSNAAIPLMLSHASETIKSNNQQTHMFGNDNQSIQLPPSETCWSKTETLKNEAQAIGFYLSAHPLENWQNKNWAEIIEKLKLTSSQKLTDQQQLKHETMLMLAGSLENIRKTRTKTGKRITFLTMNDPDGSFEITLFEEQLNLSKDLLHKGNLLVVKALLQKIQNNDIETRLRLRGETVTSIEHALMPQQGHIQIHLIDQTPLKKLKTIMEQAKKGKHRISLAMKIRNMIAQINLPGFYHIDYNLCKAIADIPGVSDICRDSYSAEN